MTVTDFTNYEPNLGLTGLACSWYQDFYCTIQINHQPDAIIFRFIILTFIYSSTCFGRSSAHHQELDDCSSSLWFYLRIVVIVVLCLWSGRLQHGYHHDTKVKPEAATAVIELLMMGGRTPETCWAVNKRQDNKLENCCIWLVIYLNCTVMHGLTNLKFCCTVWVDSCRVHHSLKPYTLWGTKVFDCDLLDFTNFTLHLRFTGLHCT